MKLFLTLFLTSISHLTWCQVKFDLSAEVSSNLNNKKIYLIIHDYYSLNKYAVMDSVLIRNNKFSFRGTIKKPMETARIFFKRPQDGVGSFSFVIDSGSNKMGINNKLPNTTDQLSNTTVYNSESNRIFREFYALQTHFFEKFGQKIDEKSTVKVLLKQDQKSLALKQLDLLKNFPNNYFSLIKLYEISSFPGMGDLIDPLLMQFKNLNENLRLSPLGREFYERKTIEGAAFKGTRTGQPVPNFSVPKVDGTIFSNKDLSGVPYIIAFSATWCIPCKFYEIKLRQVYDKYKSLGLKVIYFNLHDDYAKWKAQLSSPQPGWIDVSERKKFAQSKIVQQFSVEGIPLYLIVDRQGKIAYNRDEINDKEYLLLDSYIKKIMSE